MTPLLLCPITLALLTPGSVAALHRTPDLDSLVQSERAFSRMSVEKGMRNAFLTFLADDAIVFRPLPANGKKVWEARGPVAGTLIWEPAFAEVSAAGDLGYTTGPWEFRPPEEQQDRPVAHGHFISVWRKQPADDWKVVLDIGCNHEKPERGVGSGDLSLVPPSEQGPWPARRRFPDRELIAVERKLAGEARAKGFGGTLASWVTADVRLNREGRMPIVGDLAARAALLADTSAVGWTHQAAHASRSGDLGYTYGVLERRPGATGAAPDSSVFVHVWRRERDGRWRVALAVENPVKR